MPRRRLLGVLVVVMLVLVLVLVLLLPLNLLVMQVLFPPIPISNQLTLSGIQTQGLLHT
jgi:uncharacterized membrane protein YqjE